MTKTTDSDFRKQEYFVLFVLRVEPSQAVKGGYVFECTSSCASTANIRTSSTTSIRLSNYNVLKCISYFCRVIIKPYHHSNVWKLKRVTFDLQKRHAAIIVSHSVSILRSAFQTDGIIMDHVPNLLTISNL